MALRTVTPMKKTLSLKLSSMFGEVHVLRIDIFPSGTLKSMQPMTMLVGYFHLFIVATSCPSERCPQKTVGCNWGLWKDTG